MKRNNHMERLLAAGEDMPEAPARSTWVFLLHNETHEARQVLAKHGIRQDIDYYLTVVGQQADPSSPAKSYKLHI
jgi:hypothetical protein